MKVSTFVTVENITPLVKFMAAGRTMQSSHVSAAKTALHVVYLKGDSSVNDKS